ncbi:LemA family protein [Anaerococcus sp. mt242]|uniref:LemA family protein n=1 Tax=unclassified Anaerococcus TaxID=2614126 RepID=UPI0019341516|nr:LemA family protein [Anaerococcus sp. mt242]MBM0045825.1 LemA family protein [Anaerococcus sp. mt242]
MNNRYQKRSGFGVVGGILVVLALILFLTVPTYNRLAGSRENVNEAYAQVQNVVQRRADLIPNLVNTVKGYSDYEGETLTKITEARSGINNAESPKELADANEQLTQAVREMNVVVENYPELKANTQYTQLMDELAGSENRISVERGNYNQAVKEYNSDLKKFPTNLIAGFTGYKEAEYFQASESAQEAPKVDFNQNNK